MPKLLKSASLVTLLGGASWFGYQIYATHNILNYALDTSVVDCLESRSKKAAAAKRKSLYIEQKPEKSPSIIDRFWDGVTFSYARRLLNVAKSDNRAVRLRAINSLAEIKNLDHWHYTVLAHMCDARTAVGLARTKDVNVNFFINPPNRYVYYNHDRICSWVKHFLISLNNRDVHPCMTYFIRKAFVNVQDVGRMVEHDISSIELKQCIQSADDILPLCVQSILHHSNIGSHARDIVELNGLPLLMEIHKRYENNKDITIALVKIISNISMYPELLQDIYRSGWIGVLAKLLKHDDIKVSGPAAKALANLDSDDHLEGTFERKVYLLHPVHRSQEYREVDVILVHGLLGGVFFTWRQRDRIFNQLGFLSKKNRQYDPIKPDDVAPICKTSDPYTREYMKEIEERQKLEWIEIGKDFEVVYHDCPLDTSENGPYTCSGEDICSIDESRHTQCWPKDWLPKDCSNLRVLGINYDTKLSLWAPMCPLDKMKCTLDERSIDFMYKLIAAGVGERPIVWLTHSMGGLLVKNILVKAAESDISKINNLVTNTKGIVFFSTPHRGSHVASLNNTTALFLWPSVEVRELSEGSPVLLQLHSDFLDLLVTTNMDVMSFVETESTTISPLKISFRFVPKQSARLNYGEYYEIPLDHLRICKPVNRNSFIYKKVVLFIDKIMKENRP